MSDNRRVDGRKLRKEITLEEFHSESSARKLFDIIFRFRNPS